MPKIKVYKGGGHIVPIDVAKIATAFRCPWTKKVYGDKRSYVKHLKWLRETRMHSRIRATARLRKHQDLWNQPTFLDIIKWIEMNPSSCLIMPYVQDGLETAQRKSVTNFG